MNTAFAIEARNGAIAYLVERAVYTKVDSNTIKFPMLRMTCEYRIRDVEREDELLRICAQREVLNDIIAAITASGEVDHLLSTLLSRRKSNALSITPPPILYGKRGVKHLRHTRAIVIPVEAISRGALRVGVALDRATSAS